MRQVTSPVEAVDADGITAVVVEVDEAPDPVALEHTGHDATNAGDEEPSA